MASGQEEVTYQVVLELLSSSSHQFSIVQSVDQFLSYQTEIFDSRAGTELILTKVGDSSEIIEEQPICQQQRQNIALEIPSRTNEGSTEDFVRINIPLTPNRTPKRVNFSPIPSPSYYRFNDSPSPLSTRAKSSMKSLFPKLSFKFRNTTSEIERAAILALGDSPADTWEKPLIRRTLSLSKLFTPKMKRTSSLPVTPIAHSNPESMHGGNTIDDYVVSLLTENGNTKDDLRLPTDDALLPTENSSHDWYISLARWLKFL
ncbi:uncharacterized protein LOC114274077 [Camellia sinensis]|uniref:uncharacterized protein LOC114274077 n=1 Tax=Camellia sinensis TaxID=4442 RepID=UPI0010361283|nr:uncharacterized protein LOC114274077 [Camellia sinensis]